MINTRPHIQVLFALLAIPTFVSQTAVVQTTEIATGPSSLGSTSPTDPHGLRSADSWEKPSIDDETVSPSVSRPLGKQRRSPIDLVALNDLKRLVVINQASQSLSLIDVEQRSVIAESDSEAGARQVIDITAASEHLQDLITSAESPTGPFALLAVSGVESGYIQLVHVTATQVTSLGRFAIGMRPFGLAFSASEPLLFVSRQAADDIAVFDLKSRTVKRYLPTGRQPEHLVVTRDGRRIAVATPGDRGTSLIDVPSGELLWVDRFVGVNLGQLELSNDGQYAYFPWMVYRRFAINPNNIQRGWVLASRFARMPLEEPDRREAMSLDPPGNAIADPYGVGVMPDDSWVLVTAAGSHELLMLRHESMPLESAGSTDHLLESWQNNPDKMTRIELGGRPLGLEIDAAGTKAYIANDTLDAVQVVDLVSRKLEATISLRDPQEPNAFERGRRLFFDADRSLDAWYSCHSCHADGGTNVVAMDTHNDGSNGTFKTVLPLYQLTATTPWTWHGWQTDLEAAMHKSLTDTMEGTAPTPAEIQDLIAYFSELPVPPSSYEGAWTESLRAQVARGQALFEGDVAGCANCHQGTMYTDGLVHDVGLGSRDDEYDGFNTPSLRGLGQKNLFLHDGRATNLLQVLTDFHRPESLEGTRELTEDELEDLIVFLKSL